MTRKQFAILLATIIVGFVLHAVAQTFGALSYLPIAPTVAQCPKGQATGTTFCTVGTTGNYAIYVSFDSAAYQPLVPASSAAGVSSFNGRKGDISLTKADVLNTGIAISTVTTSTLQ